MLLIKIADIQEQKRHRAEMLKHAFVWASAPGGKYFWSKEYVRLMNNREMTHDGRERLRLLGTVRKVDGIAKDWGHNGLLRIFKLDC